MSWIERSGIVLGVVLLVALPTALHGWPTTVRGNVFTVLVLGGGIALLWWRSHPRVASVAALGLFLVALVVGGWFPETGIAIYSLSFGVLALAGRAVLPGWWPWAARATWCRSTS